MNLISTNPFTQERIAEYPELTDEQIVQKLHRSQQAFVDWKGTDFSQRARLLQALSRLLMENRGEYAGTISLEMGKVYAESLAEIEKCAWVCRYYAEEGKGQLAPVPVRTDAKQSYVRFDPLGTILGIMPWNFPFWQVFRFLAPTLMAGNTALLKHASNVQGCANHMEELFHQAGFPEAVFQNLCIRSDKVKRIIEDPAISAVTLTGSESAGVSVASLAGSQIKKAVLELGGSNAFIVFNDADLKPTVELAVKARMMNAGQSCIAAKRFLVQEGIAGDFISAFKAAIENLKWGDPFDAGTDIGPLSGIEQAREVERQVNDSLQSGAKLLTGGKRNDAFFEPTLLIDVKPDMPVFKEEVFGPVAPLMIFRDEEDAVRISNSSDFGLGVSLCTRNIDRMQRLIPRFEEGAVFINELVKSDPRLPFGGVKRSGYGRELGEWGIREFVNCKTVYIK